MMTMVMILHVVVSLALILIVLLQTGKGAEIGASFGGGSNQTVFGSRGAATFLSKITTGAAVLFMLTSLTLAYLTSRRNESVISEAAAQRAAAPAPAAPALPATPTAPARTTAPEALPLPAAK